MHVLRAGNLLRQDVLGGADPFVIVRKDGKIIGKTKVRHDTLKPVWKDESFLVQIPLLRNGAPAERCEVRLEVWDMDFASKTLMGVVRLGNDQLVTDSTIRRYGLMPECPSAKFLADPQKIDPRLGWLEIRCAVAGRLTLNVNQADDVRAADDSGTSDPFVKVRWEGVGQRTVAQCGPEKRTLNPRWNFTLQLSVPMTQPDNLFATVVVEVWDHDVLGHDFLGLCCIDPHEMTSAAESGKLITRRLLDKDEKGREKRQAAGTLSWKVEPADAICNMRKRLAKKVREVRTANRLDGTTVMFEVTKATDLKNTGNRFQLPDPYVNVVLHGNRIGRTSTRPNTLNPVWKADGREAFTLKNVPTLAGETQGTSPSEYLVRFAVFDEDLGRDDKMGEASMGWDMLMKEGEHFLPIRGYVVDKSRTQERFKKHQAAIEKHLRRAEKGRSVKKEADEQTAVDLDRIAKAQPTNQQGRRVDGRRVAAAGTRRANEGVRRRNVRAPGAALYVRVWHVARVRLRLYGAHDVRPADWGVGGGKADPYLATERTLFDLEEDDATNTGLSSRFGSA